MTNHTVYISPIQADLIWRSLWNELEKIDEDLSRRVLSEATAHQEHNATIALLQQINLRFELVCGSTFEEMVTETKLPERKWA